MDKICEFCKHQRATDTHHLIFGAYGGLRKLADEDGIVVYLCRDCHQKIHRDATVANMSKIMGQLMWELKACREVAECTTDDIEYIGERFREEYGRKWIDI